MTLPVERARSLRLGWEFLWELKDAVNLTPGQLAKVQTILRHYPSTGDIDSWAFGLPGRLYLRVENHQEAGTEPKPGVPQTVERGHVTLLDRLQALLDARDLFNVDLLVCDALTAEQRRSLTLVLQHFPGTREVDGMGRVEARVRAMPSKRRVGWWRALWLRVLG